MMGRPMSSPTLTQEPVVLVGRSWGGVVITQGAFTCAIVVPACGPVVAILACSSFIDLQKASTCLLRRESSRFDKAF